MKKSFLMLCVAVMVTMNSFSATKPAAVAVDSSSAMIKVGDSAIYNDGKKALQSIAAGTKDLATNGYDIVVQQQRMYAFQYLLVGVLALICMITFVVLYGKSQTDGKLNNKFLPALVFGIIGIWAVIVFSMHYGQVIQGFVNPDYAAIKDIVSMFKK